MKDNTSELQQSRIQSNASYMEGLEGGVSLPAPKYGLTATPNPVQKKAENNTGLQDHVKQKMENSFGQDFSDVHIHTNSNSATEMGALAYTQGNDIHFAPGEFNQSSTSGQELLGHELSHVVQQRQGRVQATHQEKGQNVNAENSLESEADSHGAIAARGGRISSGGDGGNNNSTAQKKIQKKNAPIQMWRNMPGQARIERTEPDVDGAWRAVASAIRQVAGGFAGSVMEEMRAALYGQIAQQLAGGLQTITLNNFKTYGGVNMTWRGDIQFKIDGIQEIGGGGVGSTTMGAGGSTTTGNSTVNANTGGTTGSATVSNAPPSSTGGTTVGATGGVNSSTTNTQGNTSGHTANASNSSQINQNLNRYSASIACFAHLSADTSFGDSGWDYVNPLAWASGLGTSVGTSINGAGDASSNCGTVYYYQGNGIASPPPSDD